MKQSPGHNVNPLFCTWLTWGDWGRPLVPNLGWWLLCSYLRPTHQGTWHRTLNCLRPTYICVLLYAAEWILTQQGNIHQPGAPSPTSLHYVRAHCSCKTPSQEPVDSTLGHPLVLSTTLRVIVLIHCRRVTPYGVGDPGQWIGCVVDRSQNNGIWTVQ